MKIRKTRNRGKFQPLRTKVRPGYNIQFHPRAFNKPPRCQAGIHKFNDTVVLNGVPTLVCGGCGAQIGKGIYEKTWTQKDIKIIKRMRNSQNRIKTKEERMRECWEALEQLRKIYTDAQILKLMKRRAMGIGKGSNKTIVQLLKVRDRKIEDYMEK